MATEPGPSPNRPDFTEILQTIQEFLREHPSVIGLIVLAALALFILPTLMYQVDRDERAVIMRLGAYERVEEPGLHFKLPDPIETVNIINTRRVFTREFGFRTHEAGVRSERQRSGFDREALILTGDLGVARVEWVVQYRRQEPRNFLFNVQNEERLIRDASEEAMRRIVGDWDATDVITVARVQIAQEVKDELQAIMDKYNSGIQIDDLLIQSTDAPEPVKPAFKEVDSARQDREKFRFEAEQQREKIINEAKGTADQIVEEAQGDSAAMINEAQGDAERFRQVFLEYETAPRVTKDRLFLEQMEDVMGKAEPVYIIDDNVKSLLPMMNLENKQGINP